MKFGEDLDIEIKDYLGRIGPGVTIILSVVYNSKLYEAVYWYTNTDTIIQFPEELEQILGHPIEESRYYDDIMEYLSQESSNYGDIASKLDEIVINDRRSTESR